MSQDLIAVLSISKNRINSAAKTINEGDVPNEKHGGNRISQISETKKIIFANLLEDD